MSPLNGLDPSLNRVSAMMKGKCFFITGGTGFLGKVLVEKMLRDCPLLDTIYLLVRPKKGKEPSARVDELFESPLFESLRKKRPEARKQLVAIAGDVAEKNLGISPADKAVLVERVNIVYHCAATVRFDEPLRKAIMLNTRGTKLVLDLAEEIKHLELLVYVSTAYCHLKEALLKEKIYDPPADPHKIIKCCEYMEEKIVEQMTKRILLDAPNTYAYTKALAEGLVAEKMDTLPAIILRPSVIIPIWKEPIPGWTDNINGPTGILIAAGKGVLRTMWCKSDTYADFLPVDIVANALLLATWNYIERKETHKRVYNFTSSAEFKVTWQEIIDIGTSLVEKVPLNGMVWYPGGSMKDSKTLHKICVFFFHTIPAYFLDAIIMLAGHKPILRRVQDRISKGFEVFEYYANNQWDFESNNILNLRTVVSETEKDRFCIHGDDMDMHAYFEDCIRAARIYVLKEMPETLPAARRHARRMYWLDKIVQVLFYYFLFYMVYTYSSTVRTVVDSTWDTAKSYVPPSIMGSTPN
ncbi:putative fatty acyl-CoA reductase CG5065 isoform X2 [Neocloeon triangulifer]|nr:putative fatty acyl-CoA reductase CG5065 isoform X2 [Neocloeon triangulifer]XP_059482633.1 putative fatty acyl-CoA reductase CG5065 isoform X2 [Neocloeon triangulifer]